jgi:hypothetical protein
MALVDGGFRKLPMSISDRINRSKNIVRMGLFQEIHRAWITLDTDSNDKEWPRRDTTVLSGERVYDIILWDYNSDEILESTLDPRYQTSSSTLIEEIEDGNGLIKYGLSSISFKSCTNPVLSLGLVVPRGDTYEPAVKYLLAVCTAAEVTLLVLHFDTDISGRSGSWPSIHSTMKIVHHPDGFIFPTDGIRFMSVAGSAHGRVFLGGSDGCVHEIETNTDEPISGGGSNSDIVSNSLSSSFNLSGVLTGTTTAVSGYVGSMLGIAYLESIAKKMRRTNREITTGMAMIKSLLGSHSALGYRITNMCIDHERNLLYTVSIDGRLSAYSLGAAGDEFVLISRIECMDTCAKKHFNDKGAETEARLFEEKKADKELKKLEKDVLSSVSENGLDTFLQTVAPVQSKAWPIVALNVVKVSESKRVHLVATALSGARFYFTTLADEKFKEPVNPPQIFLENQRKHNSAVLDMKPLSTTTTILNPLIPTVNATIPVAGAIVSTPVSESTIINLPKRESMPGFNLHLVYVRLPPEPHVERRNFLNGRESIASLVVPGTTTFLAVPSQTNGDHLVSLTRNWLNNRQEEDTQFVENAAAHVPGQAGIRLNRQASVAAEANQAALGRPAILQQQNYQQQQQQQGTNQHQQRHSKLECLSIHLSNSQPSKSRIYAIGEVNPEPSAVLDSCIFTPSGALLLPDGETVPLPYRSFDIRRGGGGLQLFEPGFGPPSVSQFDALPPVIAAVAPPAGAIVATGGKKKRERDDVSNASALAHDDLVGAIIKQKALEESGVSTRYSHLVRRRIWASGGSCDAEPFQTDICVPTLSNGTFELSPPELSLTYDLRASTKSFVVLTSEGIYRLRKVRVMDQLVSILGNVSTAAHSPALQQQQRRGAEGDPAQRKPIQTADLRNPLLETFFTKMPVREEAFAQIAAVACGFSNKSLLPEWRGPRGSRPADDIVKSSNDGVERDTARRSLRAFGGDPSWKANSNADIIAAKYGMSPFSRDDTGYSSRDLTFSPKFGGLSLLLSRLLRPFWRKSLFISPPLKQTLVTPSPLNVSLAVALGAKPASLLNGNLGAVKSERELLIPRFTSAECLELHIRLSAFIELFEETFEHALKVEGNEKTYKQIVQSLGSSTAKLLGRESWIETTTQVDELPMQRQQLQQRSEIEIEGTKKRKAMEMEILHQFLVLRLARRAREAAALMAAAADPSNGVSHSLFYKARDNIELVKMSKILSYRDLITLSSGEVFADRLFSLTLKMLLAEQVKRESKGAANGGAGGRPQVAAIPASVGFARFFGFKAATPFIGDSTKPIGGVGGGSAASVAASATQLSTYLRRSAPSFFSEGQALLVQAKAVTNEACKLATIIPAESRRLFLNAQDLISQAIKSLSVNVLLRKWDDLKAITDQFIASEFYSGVLVVSSSVALRCVNNDPSSLDTALPPDFISPAEGSLTLARKKAYRIITEMIEKCIQRDQLGEDLKTSQALVSTIVGDSRLSQSVSMILRDALTIRDRGFHFSLYEWLLEKSLDHVLVEAETDYIEHYLDSMAKSAANSASEAFFPPTNLVETKKHLSSRRRFKELLAQFHADKERFEIASRIFLDLSKERWDTLQLDPSQLLAARTLNPELDDRTRCLYRAIEYAERINGGEQVIATWKNDIKILQIQGSLLRFGETYSTYWRVQSGSNNTYEPLFTDDEKTSLCFEIFDQDRIVQFSDSKNLPEFAIDALDVNRNPQYREKVERLYVGNTATGELGILGQIASAALGIDAFEEIRKLSPKLMPHDLEPVGGQYPHLNFASQKAQAVMSSLQNVCKYYSKKFRPEKPLGSGGDFSFPITRIIEYLEIERALEGEGYRKYVADELFEYDFLWVAIGCFSEGVGFSIREVAYRKLLSEYWREAITARMHQRPFRQFVRLAIVWTKLVNVWAQANLGHSTTIRHYRDRDMGLDLDSFEMHKKDILREVKSLYEKIRHLKEIVQDEEEINLAINLIEELKGKLEVTANLNESSFNPNRSARQGPRFSETFGRFE